MSNFINTQKLPGDHASGDNSSLNSPGKSRSVFVFAAKTSFSWPSQLIAWLPSSCRVNPRPPGRSPSCINLFNRFTMADRLRPVGWAISSRHVSFTQKKSRTRERQIHKKDDTKKIVVHGSPNTSRIFFHRFVDLSSNKQRILKRLL